MKNQGYWATGYLARLGGSIFHSNAIDQSLKNKAANFSLRQTSTAKLSQKFGGY